MDVSRNKFAIELGTLLTKKLELHFHAIEQDKRLKQALGLDSVQATDLLKKITLAMPDRVINVQTKVAEQIKMDIIDELILFLSHESISSEYFSNSFLEFLNYLIEDVLYKNMEHMEVAHAKK